MACAGWRRGVSTDELYGTAFAGPPQHLRPMAWRAKKGRVRALGPHPAFVREPEKLPAFPA